MSRLSHSITMSLNVQVVSQCYNVTQCPGCLTVLQCHSMTMLYHHGVTKSLNVHDQGINSLFFATLVSAIHPSTRPISSIFRRVRVAKGSFAGRSTRSLSTNLARQNISPSFILFTQLPPSQFGNKCNINLTNRKRCQECRLAKCYAKVKEDRRCDCHEVFLGGICRAWKRSAFRRSRRRLQAWRGKSGINFVSHSFHSTVLPSSCINNRFII